MSDPKIVIAFLSNKLTLRGTEVAMYDYAHYNETILKNKSIIITRDFNVLRNEYDINELAYQKFQARFPVKYYNQHSAQSDIDRIVVENNVTHLYIIKGGGWDGLISSRCKNLIHCVFVANQPHGQVYSVIGDDVNRLSGTSYSVVPHMISLPNLTNNIRNEMKIPADAIVFGRYGGADTFDIGFVHNAIKRVLNSRPDVYFVFINTIPFYNHSNIRYLPGLTDMNIKRIFINSCDALIHARSGGETFGLTCGEFAMCEKPVITFGGSKENEHLRILKDKAVIYNNEEEVFEILNTFHKDKYNMKDNGYMEYTPKNIMKIFKKVYLD